MTRRISRPSGEPTSQFSVRMPDTAIEELRAIADEHNASISWIVQQALIDRIRIAKAERKNAG